MQGWWEMIIKPKKQNFDLDSQYQKSRKRGYNTPVPVKGTGCDEMNIL